MSEPTIREAIRHHLDIYFHIIRDDLKYEEEQDNLYRLFMDEAEEALISEVMKHCHGNQSHAAKILGISRNTLKKKLTQYEL